MLRCALAVALCLSCSSSKESDSSSSPADTKAEAPTANGPANSRPAAESSESPAAPPTPAPITGDAGAGATGDVTGGQSFQDGMRIICNSIVEVGEVSDPLEKQRLVAAWIGSRVTNQKVRELFAIIGDMPAKQRPGMMAAAAAKAGIQPCPIAEQ